MNWPVFWLVVTKGMSVGLIILGVFWSAMWWLWSDNKRILGDPVPPFLPRSMMEDMGLWRDTDEEDEWIKTARDRAVAYLLLGWFGTLIFVA